MTEEESFKKIFKTLKFICPMFNRNLISEAYIVGSVTKMKAKKDSDIDILLINPNFNDSSADLSPHKYETLKELNKLIDYLENTGVEFKQLKRKEHDDLAFWYQLYNNEFFHIMYFTKSENILSGDNIKITKELCYII